MKFDPTRDLRIEIFRNGVGGWWLTVVNTLTGRRERANGEGKPALDQKQAELIALVVPSPPPPPHPDSDPAAFDPNPPAWLAQR